MRRDSRILEELAPLYVGMFVVDQLSGCPRITLEFCYRADFNPLQPLERNEFRSTKLFLDARYGAINKHGSIAVVERVILTIKCLLSCLLIVPYRREAFLKELLPTVEWYNKSRPHTWLGGKTPNEVYFGNFPANRRPRFESREADGHAGRPVRSLGRWCGVVPARS